jgi:hypothetical protein
MMTDSMLKVSIYILQNYLGIFRAWQGMLGIYVMLIKTRKGFFFGLVILMHKTSKPLSCKSYPTSFPALQCEDEARHEEALVWAGHVSTQKMAVFDSYSSRSGEIFFDEIYKYSKQINSQKTSQSILFMCRAKFGTNQLKSMKIPSMFSKIYRYFWRFSTTRKAASKLHL